MTQKSKVLYSFIFVIVVLLLGVTIFYLATRQNDIKEANINEEKKSSTSVAQFQNVAPDLSKLKGRKIPANQYIETEDGTLIPLKTAVQGKTAADETLSEPTLDEQAEAQLAADFNSLLDTYSKPLNRAITKADRAKVNQTLKRVSSKNRRDATKSILNLVPDENFGVMLDTLFDKSQPDEVVSAIFDDVLNRPRETKDPILKEVAKDRDHVNCAEARRILDIQKLEIVR